MCRRGILGQHGADGLLRQAVDRLEQLGAVADARPTRSMSQPPGCAARYGRMSSYWPLIAQARLEDARAGCRGQRDGWRRWQRWARLGAGARRLGLLPLRGRGLALAATTSTLNFSGLQRPLHSPTLRGPRPSQQRGAQYPARQHDQQDRQGHVRARRRLRPTVARSRRHTSTPSSKPAPDTSPGR